jgi:hypothetical protein
MPLEERKDYRLPLEIGDKVIIKHTGGNYSTYTEFFGEAKELLVAQMGNAKYSMAKNIYCNEVKEKNEVKIRADREYEVIGFAPWGGYDDSDIEILVLIDALGNVYLFANEKCYFKEPPKHVYVDDLKEHFGENIILHLDEVDFEIN